MGGAIGLNFTDNVNAIEFSPQIGHRLGPRFQVGGSLIYRYRKDKRFDPDLTTTDYGASVFGRYFFWDPLFAQVEVERRLWQYPRAVENDGGYQKADADHTAAHVGAGFYLATTPVSAMFMTFLYDLNHDDSRPMPHSRPWQVRIGYGVTF